jgi:acyl carrier protein
VKYFKVWKSSIKVLKVFNTKSGGEISVEELLKEFITSIIEPGNEIQNDTPLYSSGLVSSMNHLQIINFIEKTFDVSIPMNQIGLANFDTIGLMAQFIQAQSNS